MNIRNSTCIIGECPVRKIMPKIEYEFFVKCEADHVNAMDEASYAKQKPENRKNPYRLQTRVDADTDFAFRALCYEQGKNVNDMLLVLVNTAIEQA